MRVFEISFDYITCAIKGVAELEGRDWQDCSWNEGWRMWLSGVCDAERNVLCAEPAIVRYVAVNLPESTASA